MPEEPGIALVAVGGLGRRECAPHGDVDLVLLHAGRDDVGRLAEALAVARDDVKVGLGLLDLRHVAGDEALSGALRTAALEQWRRDPNHPLKWRYVDGRPLYRVDAVRDYLASCDSTTKPPQPHNARGDGRATRP